MVIKGTFSLPVTKENINCLIGKANVPYRSANPDIKCISFSCPISFNLKFTNYEAQGQTIVINVIIPSVCNVYRKRDNVTSYIGDITLRKNDELFNIYTKSYVMSNTSSQIGFEINDYFTNLGGSYYPPVYFFPNDAYIDDEYTFYASMGYIISSSSSQIYYVGNNPFTCGFLFNTSQTSSYLANFSYTAGSAVTPNYQTNKMYQEIKTTQKPTWFISSVTDGNSYTPAGRNLGSLYNSSAARFNKVSPYGDATTFNWNFNDAIFTAFIPGTYLFQLCVFNNGVTTTGRFLKAGGTCVLGGSQYLSFNQSYLTSNSGAFTLSLTYYMDTNQTFFFRCDDQSPNFYYGDGHTTLQIIKIA
jgi:hypothetical protein